MEISMNKLTVYDLMGEDHYVFTKKEENDDITIEISNENDVIVYAETSSVYAWDSLVSFARMVLEQDKQLQKVNK